MPRIVELARARFRPKARLAELEEGRFDRRYGMETGQTLEPTELTVPRGDPSTGFTYVATPIRLARWWLRALPVEPSGFTFVDMGSGKGRVLALAAEHGFARVIGVEFAKELHEAAERNARAAARHGLRFESRLGDAGAFDFPDDSLVVHFNNPFAEKVMERVIASLGASYERARRPVVVVYQQRTVEEARHDTVNVELLAAVSWLSRRSLQPTGRFERWLLSAFTVSLFESPEARGSGA